MAFKMYHFFGDFVIRWMGSTSQTVFFSLTFNSDSEILAALHTVQFEQLKLQFVPKDIVLTPMSFRYSRLVGPGKGFVAIWIPVDLSSGWSL